MPLVDLNVPGYGARLPRDVRAFLREATRRIDRFRSPGRIPGFVPCDFAGAFGVLQALAEVMPGKLLCEWGSGFGVVACLAAMLDFDACGVEIEWELVRAARKLAADFELPVEFACCSFIPPGALDEAGEEFAWLTTDAGSVEDELGLAADDLDIVFAYPWPDEEWLVTDLFAHHAAVGAVLVTYHGGEEFRIRRKGSP